MPGWLGGWAAASGAAALLTGAGTWALGWWSVPAAAALAAVLWRRTPRVTSAATLGAVLAWGALLARDATGPTIRLVALQLAGIAAVPPAGLVLATLVFPALLAWGAAAVVSSVIGR